jgi:hypothetical protein
MCEFASMLLPELVWAANLMMPDSVTIIHVSNDKAYSLVALMLCTLVFGVWFSSVPYVMAGAQATMDHCCDRHLILAAFSLLLPADLLCNW